MFMLVAYETGFFLMIISLRMKSYLEQQLA